MKKSILTLLSLGLISISSNAVECKSLLEPSDFQLDMQLRAPNESFGFSVIGNMLSISNMVGFSSAAFCDTLTGDNPNKRRSCLEDLDNYIKQDSDKIALNSVNDVLQKNITYGFKTSPKAPITKEHLCIIQSKYNANTGISKSTLLTYLQKKQERLRNNYVEASKIVGQSNSFDEITNTFLKIDN